VADFTRATAVSSQRASALAIDNPRCGAVDVVKQIFRWTDDGDLKESSHFFRVRRRAGRHHPCLQRRRSVAPAVFFSFSVRHFTEIFWHVWDVIITAGLDQTGKALGCYVGPLIGFSFAPLFESPLFGLSASSFHGLDVLDGGAVRPFLRSEDASERRQPTTMMSAGPVPAD